MGSSIRLFRFDLNFDKGAECWFSALNAEISSEPLITKLGLDPMPAKNWMSSMNRIHFPTQRIRSVLDF